MTYSLPLNDPPEIEQEPRQCWSAAYESWTTACSWIIRGAQPVSEEEIEAELARYPGALNDEGAATPAGIELLGHIGLPRFKTFPGREVTTDLLAERLRRFGYLYMVFWAYGRSRTVFSHTVVISSARGGRMRIMDPGRGRGLMTRPTDYYQSALSVWIGTHARAQTP